MYYILLIIIIVAIFLLVKQKKLSSSESTETSFELISSLFTPAERSFYGVLKQAVDGETEIFAKVRVADVVKPQKGISKSAWQTAFNKISRKHFDFLLCNKNDLSVICGIELNDQSHKNKDRRERDNFLKSACSSANLPLIMLNAQQNYSLVEIRQTLFEHMPASLKEPKIVAQPLTQNPPIETPEDHAIKPEVKICPKCSTELVKRVAKKGTYAGKEFWACSAYPKCKHIEPIMLNKPMSLGE
jgi:hypothetical protein